MESIINKRMFLIIQAVALCILNISCGNFMLPLEFSEPEILEYVNVCIKNSSENDIVLKIWSKENGSVVKSIKIESNKTVAITSVVPSKEGMKTNQMSPVDYISDFYKGEKNTLVTIESSQGTVLAEWNYYTFDDGDGSFYDLMSWDKIDRRTILFVWNE